MNNCTGQAKRAHLTVSYRQEVISEMSRRLFSKAMKMSQWLRGHRYLTENKDLRLWVQSQAVHGSNFSTPDCKKINKALSVRLIVI